jgi:hypothetical protein
MPKSYLQVIVSVDHPEKTSNNITMGVDTEAIETVVTDVIGGSCEILKIVAVPKPDIEGLVTTNTIVGIESDYPA